MRKTILILFITVFGFVSQAQEKTAPKKLNWGLRSGVNLSTLGFTGVHTSDPSWKTGFVFGAFFGIRAGNNFSMQPEFLYSAMGAKDRNTVNGQESTLRLNYFSIPVLARYQFHKNWAAVLGPQFDFLVEAKQVVNGDATRISGTYDDNSINATGGIEFWPSKCIGLSARYTHGLSDISVVESESYSIRNQAIQLTLALKL